MVMRWDRDQESCSVSQTCSEGTGKEGTGQRLWPAGVPQTFRVASWHMGQAQYLSMGMVTVCSAPGALLFRMAGYMLYLWHTSV